MTTVRLMKLTNENQGCTYRSQGNVWVHVARNPG